ncbi:putative TE1b [Blumeria hordei DH14]|uniref:Putative TE1b n=1 Tax=Blumeria graminis f. sp. hordei (strain DH14) TaxID=546991 RepID=N1JAU3_BLUG1|nr:putative TE1b [Blumeria hordei DH14]
MYPVRSEIALECASDALRDTITGISPSLHEDNTVIEAASKWTSLILPHVPLLGRQSPSHADDRSRNANVAGDSTQRVPVPGASDVEDAEEPTRHQSASCMARPRRQNGIILPRTPAELHIIKESRHRDYHAALVDSERKGKAVETVIAQNSKMSLNVGRGGEYMDIALQQAWDAGANVVMVQEPWTRKKEEGFIKKSHPDYNRHILFGRTDVLLRAITFTRKGSHATQMFPPSSVPTSDYCFVKMGDLTFVNMYRAPGTSVVVGGDFNSMSQHWQPLTTNQYGNGNQVIEWATAHDMDLVSIVREQTHRDENVLDLTWSNTAAIASVSTRYHCTSDHSTIEGTVLNPTGSDLSGIVRNIWVSDANLKEFSRCWSDECRIEWQEYKAVRHNPDLANEARKIFRVVVRKAKRDYWKRQVELSNSREQASWLRDILLARFSGENDISTWDDGQEERIPWDTEISLEDVTKATIFVNDTVLGADEITVRLLKACWSHLGSLVKDLYQTCLNIGRFPTAFRVAEQLISLLSNLCNGLKILVGKRMAWLTISHQVVHPQLFGSVPGRSAVDLASCVIHDADAAMRSVDCSNAFENKSGHYHCAGLFRPFRCQRKFQVKYCGGITEEKILECGVPQSSPLSPLLFMLYIAVLGGPRKKINAADLSILVKDRRIESSPHIRWLGVWLDTQLNFKQNVQEWTGKANRLVHFLRHTNGVQRGAAPGPLIRAVHAFVLSTALYGAEAWWPGLTQIATLCPEALPYYPFQPLKYTQDRVGNLNKMGGPALHFKAGIPPASIILQQKMLWSAARMQRMDAWHPLVLRAAEGTKDTISRLGLRSGQINHLFRQSKRYITRLQMSVPQVPIGEGPRKLYFSHGPPLAGSSSGPLSGAEVFDAEVVSAIKALETAIAVREDMPIYILLDSQAATRMLDRERSNSSQVVVDKFSLQRHNKRVDIRSIADHVGIQGNEDADKLAKSALGTFSNRILTSDAPSGEDQDLTFAALWRWVNQRGQDLVEERWQKYRPKQYKDLELFMHCKRPPELTLPIWAYHHLIAAGTGHEDYADYHRRFNPEYEDLKCVYGREKRPWHVSERRPALQRRRGCEERAPPGAREMIGEKGWQKFI